MRSRNYRKINNVIILIMQVFAIVELLMGDYLRVFTSTLLIATFALLDISVSIDTIRRTKVLEYARGKTD